MTGGGEDSSPSAPAQDPATGGSGGAERGEGGEEEGPSPPSAPAGSSYPQRHVAALINLGAVLANTAAAPSSTSEDDDVAFRRRCEEALGLQIEASRALTEGLLLSSSRVSGGGGGGGAAAAAANPITVNPSSANPNEAKSAAAPPLLVIEKEEATAESRRRREEREERVLRRLKSVWEYHKGRAEASLRLLRDNDRKMMNGHPLAGVLQAALLVVNGTPPPPPPAVAAASIFFVPEDQPGEDEGEEVRQEEEEGERSEDKAMTIKCKYNTYLENDFGVPYFCYTSSVASRDENEARTFQHNNKRARRDQQSGNPLSRTAGGCAMALRRFLPIFPQSMYQEMELFASLPYPVTVLIREGFALDCNEGDKMKEGGSDRERDNFSRYCCYSSGANKAEKSRNESLQQPPSSLGHGNIFDRLPTSHSFPETSAAAPSSGPPAPAPPRCHPSGPPAHFMLDAFQEEIARAQRRQLSQQQQASKNPSKSDGKKTPSLEEERKRKNRQQRKAAAARDTVVLLYNAALCHHRLGDDESALRLFSRARIVLNESYNAMEEAMEKEAEEEAKKDTGCGGDGGNDAAEGHHGAPTWEPTLQDVSLRLLSAQASQNEGQIHDRYGQRQAAALAFLTAYGDAADAFEMAAMCLNGSEAIGTGGGSSYATLLAQCVRCAALARSNLGRSEYLRGRLGEALAELRDGADVLTRFADVFPLDLNRGDEEGEGSSGRVAVLPPLVLPPGTKAVMERDASLLAHNAAIVQRMMAARRVGGMEGSRQSGQR